MLCNRRSACVRKANKNVCKNKSNCNDNKQQTDGGLNALSPMFLKVLIDAPPPVYPLLPTSFSLASRRSTCTPEYCSPSACIRRTDTLHLQPPPLYLPPLPPPLMPFHFHEISPSRRHQHPQLYGLPTSPSRSAKSLPAARAGCLGGGACRGPPYLVAWR